jgi:hypothetical protein
VYLGPDENIVPQDIEWIVRRAEHRKYAFPQVCHPPPYGYSPGCVE